MTARLALAFALVACGGSHSPFPSGAPDAPPPDTLATSGDGGASAVSITVTSAGMPVAGAAVFFQSSDGTLVLGATTDENGNAAAMVGAGGFVTTLRDDGSGTIRLMTFAGVKPADRLTVDLGVPDTSPYVQFPLTVTSDASAADYIVNTTCGNSSLGLPASGIVSLAGCGGMADMIVVEQQQIGQVMQNVASYFAPNIPVNGNAETASGTYAPLVTASYDYTNIPATLTDLRTLHRITTSRGVMYEDSFNAAVSSPHITPTLAVPAVPTNVTGFEIVTDGSPVASEHGEQLVFDWGPTTATSNMYALDLGAAMLPAFADVPTFDPTQRRVSWQERVGGAVPNVVRTSLSVFRDGFPSGRSWTWSLVAARNAAATTFPKLPVVDFDYNPAQGDAIAVTDLTTMQVPGGYDAVRAHGFNSVTSFVSGASGHMVVELLYAPPL